MKKIKWEEPVIKKISDDAKDEMIAKGDCLTGVSVSTDCALGSADTIWCEGGSSPTVGS